MTSWEKIVTGKELVTAKNLRKRTYIVKKERRVSLAELEEEGWKEFKTYKDKRFVGVKKDKSCDEIFEDKVWTLFANMGFTDMNTDRCFKMQYDFKNPEITQQIDVFAADEETVIIVECKATKTVKKSSFKKMIEAYYGQMDGLRKEAQKKYPGRKVKFIWASSNYIMNKATINYYFELAKHLGSCARYQLLGNLFANQEIRNMDNKIPAIEGKMGGNKYYSFSIEPEKLLKIGYVLHRNEANKSMMPTYQRIIKKKRLQDIQKFIIHLLLALIQMEKVCNLILYLKKRKLNLLFRVLVFFIYLKNIVLLILLTDSIDYMVIRIPNMPPKIVYL